MTNTDTLNRLEQEIGQAEGNVEDKRWQQAEEVYRRLDGGETQQQIADSWINLRTGRAYGQTHVAFVAKAWRHYLGNNDRPSWNTAYQAAKKSTKPRASTNGKPPKDEAPKSKAKPVDNPTITGKQGLSHYPAVIAFVRDRIREGWDRNRIVAASKANTHGWPLPGEALSNGGVSECRAVIAALEQVGVEPGRDTDEGERRERNVQREKREAKIARNQAAIDLLKLRERVNGVVRVLETTDFDADFDLTEVSIDALMELTDDLLATIDWCERALPTIKARLGKVPVLELIEKLENVHGRSPVEAAPFLKRAARLRREHGLLAA